MLWAAMGGVVLEDGGMDVPVDDERAGRGQGSDAVGGKWLTWFLRCAPPTVTKGTTSFGKRHTKTHTVCRRCNKRSFHRQHKLCAACGFPAAKIRSYEWGQKAKRRRTTGTGRMRHMKEVPRRAKNGFRTGVASKAVAASA